MGNKLNKPIASAMQGVVDGLSQEVMAPLFKEAVRRCRSIKKEKPRTSPEGARKLALKQMANEGKLFPSSQPVFDALEKAFAARLEKMLVDEAITADSVAPGGAGDPV